MDDPEASSSKLPTITPILRYFLIPVFRFPDIFCVSDIILKEFRFEFIPLNQIGLCLIHVSNLRVPDPETTLNELKEVKM